MTNTPNKVQAAANTAGASVKAHTERALLTVTEIVKLNTRYEQLALESIKNGRSATKLELAEGAYVSIDSTRRPKSIKGLIDNPTSTIFQLQEAFVAEHGIPWNEEAKPLAKIDDLTKAVEVISEIVTEKLDTFANQLLELLHPTPDERTTEKVVVAGAPIDDSGFEGLIGALSLKANKHNHNILQAISGVAEQMVTLSNVVHILTGTVDSLVAVTQPLEFESLPGKEPTKLNILIVGLQSSQAVTLERRYGHVASLTLLSDLPKSGGTITKKYDHVLLAQTIADQGVGSRVKQAYPEYRNVPGGVSAVVKYMTTLIANTTSAKLV